MTYAEAVIREAVTREAVTRAAIYTRVSLDRDGTKDSPETQELECRAFCRLKGWDVTDVYCDRDRSAFKPDARRPAFDRMMRDVKAGGVDAVVAYKLDRLTRGGLAGIAPILERLRKVGADMAFVHDQVDTSTAMGEGVLGLLASVAKQESENISRRVRSASQRAARSGALPTGGSRQFGYARDGSIMEDEAAVARDVAERVLAGESLRQVAFDLNDRGIATTQGNPWTSQTLGQMMRSPRLAALRFVDQDAVEGLWEAILSREKYLDVVDALERPAGVRRSARRHLLTGLASCGVCGGSMKTMGWRMKNGRVFPRYQCVRQPGFSNCGKVAVTKTSLDAYVIERTLDFLTDAHLLPLSDDTDRLTGMRADLMQDQESQRQLTEDRYVHRTIPEAAYVSAREKLAARIATLEEQITALERQRDALGPLQRARGNRDALQAWWDGASIEEQRTALAEAIQEVRINPAEHRGGNRFNTDRVEIRWRWDLFVRASEAAWDQMSEGERREALEEATVDGRPNVA